MYDLINIKPKRNFKKISIFIILLIILSLIINFFVIKNKKNENTKENREAVEVVSQAFELQTNDTNQNEKVAKKEEISSQEIKIYESLNSEQMQKIESIYKNTEEKRVFLTFDDGPSKTVTPHILDILKNENIKATFFVLGSRVEYNPDLVKRAYKEGHYIANHGYSHIYSNIYCSIDTIFNEYNKTEACIQNAIENENYHSNLFRFPGGSNGGKYNKIKQEAKEELRKNNIAYLDWNALSNDSAGAKTKEDLMENIINTVGNKNSVVILMHDAGDKVLTYETLPDVIKFLKEKGYKFQNIYDLLN